MKAWRADSRERVKACAEGLLAALDGEEAKSEDQKRFHVGAIAAKGLLAIDVKYWGDTPHSIAGILLPLEPPHAAPVLQSATIGYWGLHLYASLRAITPVAVPVFGPEVSPAPVVVDGKKLEELIAKVDALSLAVQNIRRGGFSIPLALVNSFSLIEISAVSLDALVRMNKIDVRTANYTLADISNRARKGRSHVGGPLAEAWSLMRSAAAAAAKKAAQLVDRHRLSTPEEDTASQKVRLMILQGKTPPRRLREQVRELMFGDIELNGDYTPDGLKDVRLVATCPNLQNLIIAGCPVSDLSPLKVLQRLTFIEFSGTKVYDATPLRECRALREAFFKDTPAAERDGAHLDIADHTFCSASVMQSIANWTPTSARAAAPRSTA